jgi:hypothetical protein
MELENIMLGEVSQAQKAKSHMFLLILGNTGHTKGRSYMEV